MPRTCLRRWPHPGLQRIPRRFTSSFPARPIVRKRPVDHSRGHTATENPPVPLAETTLLLAAQLSTDPVFRTGIFDGRQSGAGPRV